MRGLILLGLVISGGLLFGGVLGFIVDKLARCKQAAKLYRKMVKE